MMMIMVPAEFKIITEMPIFGINMGGIMSPGVFFFLGPFILISSFRIKCDKTDN